MSTDPIGFRFERDAAVTTVVLDHGRVNIVDPELIESLIEHLPTVLDDPSVRCIVIRGKGRIFVGGANLKVMRNLDPDTYRAMRRWVVVQRLLELAPKPVVAALNGWLDPVPEPQVNWFVAGVDAVLAFVGLSAPDSNDHLIKRVIGLPGDTVVCCNDFGQLTVNGIPLEEPYIKLAPGVTKATNTDFEVTVPEGRMWVMGDNRYNSSDSTRHLGDPGGGTVPIDNVVGRALLISWPVNRWSWLDNYPVTFRDVEDARPSK